MRDLQTNSICLTKVNVTSALARYIRFFSRSLRRELLGFAPFVPHFAKLRLHSVSLRMTHSRKRQRLPPHYPERSERHVAARELPGTSGVFPEKIYSPAFWLLHRHFIKPVCSAFSFGEKGAKEKAWQKEIRRKKVSRSAERDLGRCPKNPQTF